MEVDKEEEEEEDEEEEEEEEELEPSSTPTVKPVSNKNVSRQSATGPTFFDMPLFIGKPANNRVVLESHLRSGFFLACPLPNRHAYYRSKNSPLTVEPVSNRVVPVSG